MTYHDFMREASAWVLLRALEENGHNVTAAARSLGMDRAWFYKVAERDGVQIRPAPRYPAVLSPEFRRFLGATGRTQCPPNS